MNTFIGIGNLTRDAELRTTQSGKSVCGFTLAINRKFKSQDGAQQADYINVVVWDKLADACAKYLSKGSKVGVMGTVQTRSYEARDGSKRNVTEVVANEVEFLSGGKKKNEAVTDEESKTADELFGGDEGFQPLDDAELPF